MKKRRAKRRDRMGRAYRGSQKQIQLYINRRQFELSATVLEALRSAGANYVRVEWVAPLERNRFSEPCDGRFLDAVGLARWRASLAEFWPKGGPRWDALAILQPGEDVLLVEAKNYPSEILGGGCKATPIARELIERSLAQSRAWFGASDDANWLGPLYQYANRLSHVRFLREVCRRQAWLANVCFIDDPHKCTTRQQWRDQLPSLKRSLGFAADIPHVIDVFLTARSRKELLSRE